MDVYLNLGSNIGDSEALIGRAVALILERFSPIKHKVSPPFRSNAWGYQSENVFVNVGLGMRLPESIDPLEILQQLQKIEAVFNHTPHRNADGSYADRELDIDIIEIEGVELNHPRLTLPHPRAHLRDFVQIPLSQTRLNVSPKHSNRGSEDC